ncbi:helix-turn-helix transcriptional regulator [Chroococcidiopsis sp. SAG 2025]|uniref:helix-turn-helix domain-containing protein n=1 Tax=Chroococcidiopsis sp. SAG 2025 TaxID=171389 RepID=UPI002936FBC0|nr:helix-turn-helix transcriptional regulator [Chroococcidiopsis sp. SAG 2025]
MKVKRSIEKYAPGLGAKIRQARKSDKRSVETLCGLAEVSRVYWYDIENENIRDALPEETLRRIEKVLGVDLGVNFEEAIAS